MSSEGWWRRRDVILGGTMLSLGVLFCLILAWGQLYAPLDFSPINGDFQNLNPIKRINAGQLPGRDFDSYLGLGPVYVLYFFQFISGRDFTFDMYRFCIILQTHIVFLLACVFMFRALLSLSWTVSSACSLFLLACATTYEIHGMGGPRILPGVNLQLLSWHANSNYATRFAIVPVAAMILIYALGMKRSAVWRTRFAASTCGCLSGLSFFWSPDFGLPVAFFSAVVFFVWHFWGRAGSTPSVLSAFLPWTAFFVVIVVFIFGVHGFSEQIIRYPMDIADWQQWYFPCSDSDILPLGSSFGVIPVVVFVSAFVLFVRSILFAWRGTFPPINFLALCFCWFACLLSGAGSILKGMTLPHYWTAAAFISFFVIADFFISLVGVLFDGRFPVVGRRISVVSRVVVVVVSLVFITGAISSRVSSVEWRRSDSGVSSDSFWGRGVPVSWVSESMDRLRGIDGFSDSYASEYSSYVDAVFGKIGPARSDYVIHALGDRRSELFVDSVLSRDFFLSVRRSNQRIGSWADWIEKRNASLHYQLMQFYRPIDATEDALVWRRRASPLDQLSNLNCISIFDGDGESVRISISESGFPLSSMDGLVGMLNTRCRLGRPYWVIYPNGTKICMPGDRAGSILITDAKYGVFLRLVGGGVVRSDDFLISGARWISAADERAAPLVSHSENWTDANWTNGIANKSIISNPGECAFFTRDPRVYSGFVRAGDAVVFAASGKRVIKRIAGDQFWCEGEPLNAQVDGYPNDIVFMRR